VPDVGGLDFGIRNPTVALWGYEDYDGVLWITGCHYQANKTILEHSTELPSNVHWWADPAGAQERELLRKAGHSVTPCVHMPIRGASGETKSPLNGGIDMVKERMRSGRLKIVRPKCRELVRELGMYMYDPAKPEKEDPLKQNDHAPDALRYLVVGLDRGRYGDRLAPAVTVPDLWSEEAWQ
jgi:phage terminase large subunit